MRAGQIIYAGSGVPETVPQRFPARTVAIFLFFHQALFKRRHGRPCTKHTIAHHRQADRIDASFQKDPNTASCAPVKQKFCRRHCGTNAGSTAGAVREIKLHFRRVVSNRTNDRQPLSADTGMPVKQFSNKSSIRRKIFGGNQIIAAGRVYFCKLHFLTLYSICMGQEAKYPGGTGFGYA